MPWKHQKTRGFLIFSEGIEREQRYEMQKLPFRGVLRKRCSENMQQIYKKTPMPKCDSVQRYWIRTSVWVFSIFSEHLFLTT